MNKVSKIPEFESIEEEAHFWDTHDITDYMDEMEPVEIEFAGSIYKDDSMTIRLQPDLKKKLADYAKSAGVSPSTLTRMWIIEKLREVTGK